MADKKSRIVITLMNKTIDKLENLSNETGMTKSVIIELALKNYLRNK